MFNSEAMMSILRLHRGGSARSPPPRRGVVIRTRHARSYTEILIGTLAQGFVAKVPQGSCNSVTASSRHWSSRMDGHHSVASCVYTPWSSFGHLTPIDRLTGRSTWVHASLGCGHRTKVCSAGALM